MKKAVIIGITYAEGPEEDQLESSAIDVRNMREFLTRRGYAQLRILSDDPKDPSPNNIFPSEVNIREALKWLVTNTSAGDQLFLHFSGHGQQVKTSSPTESDGMDEVMRPAKGESIRDNDLRAILVDNLPPGCQLVALFDCCHSGTLLDLHFRARAEHSVSSRQMNIVRDTHKALVRAWRWAGPAIYSARLNSPRTTPSAEGRSPTHPLPNGFQVPDLHPLLVREDRTTTRAHHQRNRDQSPTRNEYEHVVPFRGPTSAFTLQDGPGVGLGIQHTIPLSFLGYPTPKRSLTKNPVKKWVSQLSKFKHRKILCKAPLVESPPMSPRSTFARSPSPVQREMSPAPALSQFAMGPITQTDISGTTLITQAGPVLHMPPQQTFHPLSQDTGYTVERRSTFTAFHSPSEDLKRVITYSACTDAENVYDINGRGGLLTSNFIRFMNQREHTLSNMLIRLTMKFAEVNKRHIHGTPGQPPTALLCTADFVKLDDQLVI